MASVFFKKKIENRDIVIYNYAIYRLQAKIVVF